MSGIACEKGLIARTTSSAAYGSGAYGSFSIDAARPYCFVTGVAEPIAGERLSHMSLPRKLSDPPRGQSNTTLGSRLFAGGAILTLSVGRCVEASKTRAQVTGP